MLINKDSLYIMLDKLSTGKLKIIGYLASREIAMLTEIMRNAGLSHMYCKRYLRELVEDGIVEEIQLGKRILFRLKKENPFVFTIARLVSVLAVEYI